MLPSTVLERVWLDDAELRSGARPLFTASSPTSPTGDMSFPASSRASFSANPSLILGPSTSGNQSFSKATKHSSMGFFSPNRLQRASSVRPSERSMKPLFRGGKESIDGNGSMSPTSPTHRASDRDFSIAHYSTLTPPLSIENSRPSTREAFSTGANLKRSRTSLLVAASDAFGRKFGRRRPSIKQSSPMPIILPDVIDISSIRKDEEAEEREQLREMAAQSIGIDPILLHRNNSRSRDDITQGDEEDDGPHPRTTSPWDMRSNSETRNSDNPFSDSLNSRMGQSHEASIRESQQSHITGRYRGSVVSSHSRTNSSNMPLIPPYPTCPAFLSRFRQHAIVTPKYYPPSSLRIFALSNISKNWKNRFLIMSSPKNIVIRGSGPAVSYLHLFKSSHPDEKELERLEINENSVVFVAEEEIGGRRHVIKVGGVDVGAMKKDLTTEEGGRTMWFLQITDPSEAQTWISAIKNAILGQRSVRAGLGLPSLASNGASEPRGDLDVMLSMRAQGFISSSGNAVSRLSPAQAHTQPEGAYTSSLSSGRSQSVVAPKPPSAGAVSTLKGLFSNSNRPRATSRAASVENERRLVERQSNDELFGKLNNNLFAKVRPPPDRISHNTVSSSGNTSLTVTSSSLVGHQERLDRKIVPDGQNEVEDPPWTSFDDVLPTDDRWSRDRSTKAMSLGTWSLQPAPRKRWTSTSVITPEALSRENSIASPNTNASGLYTHIVATTSIAGSFGQGLSHEKARDGSIQTRDRDSGISNRIGDDRSRTLSLGSVSTVASTEQQGGSNVERSGSSSKGSMNTRRWTRQGTLPSRTSPPIGPPPPIPSVHSNHSRPQPYADDSGEQERPLSGSSTISDGSEHSIISSLPSFNAKRGSTSSAVSSGSGASTPSQTFGVPTVPSSQKQHQESTSLQPPPRPSHRTSLPPPPRPVPTIAPPPTPFIPITPTTYNSILAKPPAQEQYPSDDHPLATKSTFRESLPQRVFRRSTVTSRPHPSITLPPHLNETLPSPSASSSSIRGRSYSSDSGSQVLFNNGSINGSLSGGSTPSLYRRPVTSSGVINVPLNSIQGSPLSQEASTLTALSSPFPPPSGPLPPTPSVPISPTSPGFPRNTTNSIKHRFRMLSAPSPLAINNTSHNSQSTDNSTHISANADLNKPTSPTTSNYGRASAFTSSILRKPRPTSIEASFQHQIDQQFNGKGPRDTTHSPSTGESYFSYTPWSSANVSPNIAVEPQSTYTTTSLSFGTSHSQQSTSHSTISADTPILPPTPLGEKILMSYDQLFEDESNSSSPEIDPSVPPDSPLHPSYMSNAYKSHLSFTHSSNYISSTYFYDDPSSFLQMATPVPDSLSLPPSLSGSRPRSPPTPPPASDYNAVSELPVSLSPPPRRNSRQVHVQRIEEQRKWEQEEREREIKNYSQVSFLDTDFESVENSKWNNGTVGPVTGVTIELDPQEEQKVEAGDEAATLRPPQPLSLSRPGSLLSLR